MESNHQASYDMLLLGHFIRPGVRLRVVLPTPGLHCLTVSRTASVRPASPRLGHHRNVALHVVSSDLIHTHFKECRYRLRQGAGGECHTVVCTIIQCK